MLCLSSVLGCNAAPPRVIPPTSASYWRFENHVGQVLRTPHYAIYTTIGDRQTTQELSTLMEAALRQYQQLAPAAKLTGGPLPCYIFAQRSEWADYTRAHTGAMATLYLKINRGGYTIDDTFVAYLIGQSGTDAVAAHEGFHQFVARNFKTRLPPFLEEGIASLFENIRWTGEQPHWDLSINASRTSKLRRAIENGELWPLEQLSQMHAGDVVNLPSRRIETFYAQDWAFAQFLARDPRYVTKFKTMMNELADGSAARFSTLPADAPSGAWDPKAVQPLLEHYMGVPLERLSRDYAGFVKQIAYNSRSVGPME